MSVAWANDPNAPQDPSKITTTFTQPGNTDLIMFIDGTNYYPFSISKGHFTAGGTLASAWSNYQYAPTNTASLKGAFNIGNQTLFYDTTSYFVFDWGQGKFLAPPPPKTVQQIAAASHLHDEVR